MLMASPQRWVDNQCCMCVLPCPDYKTPISGDCFHFTVWYVAICHVKCWILLTCFVYMAIYDLEIQQFHSFSVLQNCFLKQPLGMTSILVLLPHWSSESHGSCFYFFQNFHIFTNIFNQHFYETRRNPNKLFVYLKDDWMFSQHWATCWWHRPSVG